MEAFYSRAREARETEIQNRWAGLVTKVKGFVNDNVKCQLNPEQIHMLEPYFGTKLEDEQETHVVFRAWMWRCMHHVFLSGLPESSSFPVVEDPKDALVQGVRLATGQYDDDQTPITMPIGELVTYRILNFFGGIAGYPATRSRLDIMAQIRDIVAEAGKAKQLMWRDSYYRRDQPIYRISYAGLGAACDDAETDSDTPFDNDRPTHLHVEHAMRVRLVVSPAVTRRLQTVDLGMNERDEEMVVVRAEVYCN